MHSCKIIFQLTDRTILNKGHLKCLYCLISSPEKLDVDMVMSIEHLTRKISPKVFYKETYSGEKEGKILQLLYKSFFYSLCTYSLILCHSIGNNLMTRLLFYSEFRSGLYCSLYEVVEKTRLGSNLEGLLQKLEKDKLVSSCSPRMF